MSIRSAAQAPAGVGLYPVDIIRDLPVGADACALLETAQPEVIVDRFTSGGVSVGDPARASAFLASWAQTQYRVGDVSISSPVDGTPLLFPEVAWWDGMAVRTGAMPADLAAPGLDVSFTPAPASTQWSGTLDGSIALGSTAVTAPPSIARVDDWFHLTCSRAARR